jgi:hypothetical protein
LRREGAAGGRAGRTATHRGNLATAVATGGDAIPELVGELRKRNERIRQHDNDLAAAKRSPEFD